MVSPTKIYNYNNINISNLIINNEQHLTQNTKIKNIMYNNNKLIIQTPKLTVPFLPKIFKHNNVTFYKLQLIGKLFNKKDNNFFKFIKNIDNYIKKRIKTNQRFIKTYKYNNNKERTIFNFNFQTYNNKPVANIYDSEKKLKTYKYICKYSKAYSLLWLKNIWIKSNKIGLNWIILQMKVYLPFYKIDKYLIIDDDDDDDDNGHNYDKHKSVNTNHIKLIDHPIFRKYFMMKKYGVPINNIKLKMKTNKLDYTIIDEDYNKLIKYKKNNEIKNNEIKNNNNFNLNNIKNFKLKKTKKNIKKTFSKTNKKGIPTLEEILNQINLLKKTNKNLL